jgi:pyruvate dehydrogenase E2 component (dihydrolipoamide acetyltransferase)
MAVEIKVPNLGEGVASGDVLEIFVKEGDMIKKDQGILELETDKATSTIPATQAGKVIKVHVSEGQTVKIGDVVVTLEGSAAAAEQAPAKPAPAESAPAPKPPAKPAPPAAKPVKPAPVAATPPVAPTAPAPVAPAPVQVAMSTATPEASSLAENDESVAAGPSIRRLAREVGVDLVRVVGSGPGGRVTREDVLAVVRNGNRTAANAAPTPAGNGAPAPVAGTASGDEQTDNYGPVRIEKMPKIRQTIANKMHESWTTCPRVTNFDDADVTDLEEFRQASKGDYAARGIKLTSLPFVLKATAMALKQNPAINASVDMQAGTIIYKQYVNIGVAVDTERGLVVPVLRNVDRKSIADIAREMDQLVERVRGSQFSVDDLRGGTFSISNLGAVGGTYSTPIINIPEAAILLLGRSRKLPVVVGDKIIPRLMMPLSLSYDHRLIDGAAAARFLNDLIGYLSAPSRILLAP